MLGLPASVKAPALAATGGRAVAQLIAPWLGVNRALDHTFQEICDILWSYGKYVFFLVVFVIMVFNVLAFVVLVFVVFVIVVFVFVVFVVLDAIWSYISENI